ncbi:MAG: hypothetical protein MJ239_02825 [Bacilli bacterium]|nr:hypothetical protein [Bacilli bacterium]
MKKKNLLLVAASLTVLTGCAGEPKAENPGYEVDHYASDAKVIEGIKLDAKREAEFYVANPYVSVSKDVNRDQAKYKAFADTPECESKTYVGYGEHGLFLYAETDDQIVNLNSPTIFSRSGYEFYICSPDADTPYGHIYEVTVSADGALLVRRRYNNGSGGAYERLPAAGAYSAGKVNPNGGYSVEAYLPYTLLNMEDAKVEEIGVGTAMIRLNSAVEFDNHYFWEMLDMNTGKVNPSVLGSYPLFKKNGYVPSVEGANFENPHSSGIDVSKDNGDFPEVTFRKNGQLTLFLKDSPTFKDVYWSAKVKINDFYRGDDPRIGIMVKTKATAENYYSQAYNFLELDKNAGETYVIKDQLTLPSVRNSSGTKNIWDKSTKVMMGSQIEKGEFTLGIYRKGASIYTYLNDVLVTVKSDMEFLKEDTDIYLGLVSWFTGATFSEYYYVTENLDEYMKTKNNEFIYDEHLSNNYADSFEEGVVSVNCTKNLGSIVNLAETFNEAGFIEATITSHDTYNYSDSRSGVMVTYPLDNDYYRLAFLLRYNNTETSDKKTTYLDCYFLKNDIITWDSSMNLQKASSLSLGAQNKMSVYVKDGVVSVLVNDALAFEKAIPTLSSRTGDYRLGLTGWKSDNTFTQISHFKGEEATTHFEGEKNSSYYLSSENTHAGLGVFGKVDPVSGSVSHTSNGGYASWFTNKDKGLITDEAVYMEGTFKLNVNNAWSDFGFIVGDEANNTAARRLRVCLYAPSANSLVTQVRLRTVNSSGSNVEEGNTPITNIDLSTTPTKLGFYREGNIVKVYLNDVLVLERSTWNSWESAATTSNYYGVFGQNIGTGLFVSGIKILTGTEAQRKIA